MQGKLLTNSERVIRHLATDESCSICNSTVENIGHVLRHVLKPEERNNCLFDVELYAHDSVLNECIRMERDLDMFLRVVREAFRPWNRWSKPNPFCVKANADGAIGLRDNMTACAGVIRDENGDCRNQNEVVDNLDGLSCGKQAREKFVSLKKNTPEDIVAELEEGYELLKQLEPFIHQVYTYAQQAKELANAEQCSLEKRIQEFRTQAEIDTLRASSNIESTTSSAGICVTSVNSDKNIEAIMQSSINGEIQIIKQGYLLKRSSSLRGDWKRRFFVLDSQGTLYYYRHKGVKPTGFLHHYAPSAVDHNSGVFARFRSKYKSPTNENLGCHTVDLRTSTIKMDAEDTDLRLCFRIISPLKTYTFQAENAGDRMDWVNKITAVITSLLNNPILLQHVENNDYARRASNVSLPYNQGASDDQIGTRAEPVSAVLREIPGNDVCAECNAHEPEWASLNLGILLCIGCSGVHRNLGVHISKVRSLTLDVKVWEPSVVELFRTLGNSYCNSIWEGLLLQNESVDESNAISKSITKPCPKDPICDKEKYINAKYVSKLLIIRDPEQHGVPQNQVNIWHAVKADNLREVYHLIAVSDTNIVNTTFDDVISVKWYHHVDAHNKSTDSHTEQWIQNDPTACQRIKNSDDPRSCLQGCSLLHLACQSGNPVMVELLLLFGADINMRDFHGRTPLHHCIASGMNTLAKHLLKRGARPSIRDGGRFSALDRAMEKGAITDEGLLILLTESD
ncbi:hypothetical protein V6N11_067794 [Hibiscus sabdariffa]|uniref:Uncharacterized protein n=1 Tax=Hibiscus sabdariffa TaxID=183260 RepID=A0ABR2SRT4_9ROSI